MTAVVGFWTSAVLQQPCLLVLLHRTLLQLLSSLVLIAARFPCEPGWRWAWSWRRPLGRSGGCSPAAQQRGMTHINRQLRYNVGWCCTV